MIPFFSIYELVMMDVLIYFKKTLRMSCNFSQALFVDPSRHWNQPSSHRYHDSLQEFMTGGSAVESSPPVAIDRGFFHCFHFNFGGKNRSKIMFQEDYDSLWWIVVPKTIHDFLRLLNKKTKKKKRKQITMSPTLSQDFSATSRPFSGSLFFFVSGVGDRCAFLHKNFRAAPKTEKEIKGRQGRFRGWNLLRCVFFGGTGFLCAFLFFLNHPIIPFLRSFFKYWWLITIWSLWCIMMMIITLEAITIKDNILAMMIHDDHHWSSLISIGS